MRARTIPSAVTSSASRVAEPDVIASADCDGRGPAQYLRKSGTSSSSSRLSGERAPLTCDDVALPAAAPAPTGALSRDRVGAVLGVAPEVRACAAGSRRKSTFL